MHWLFVVLVRQEYIARAYCVFGRVLWPMHTGRWQDVGRKSIAQILQHGFGAIVQDVSSDSSLGITSQVECLEVLTERKFRRNLLKRVKNTRSVSIDNPT